MMFDVDLLVDQLTRFKQVLHERVRKNQRNRGELALYQEGQIDGIRFALDLINNNKGNSK